MATILCPKCSYARKPADNAVPDWRCPSCGIAYAKYGGRAAEPAPAHGAHVPSARAGHSMSAKALFWILAAVTVLGYAGYQKLSPKTQPEENGMSGFPTIVIGNRVTHGFDEGQILASLEEL
jgi:hypothetical protein